MARVIFEPATDTCRRCGDELVAGERCECKQQQKIKQHKAIRKARRAVEGAKYGKVISVH